MNIEIANRLVQLRKENNYSQQSLADELGLSRQAVSKWERAEASPDTDNLILLARLYGVSLDELLATDDEIPTPDMEEETKTSNKEENESEEKKCKEYVHVGLDGIHVVEKDGSNVHVGWKGIHVEDHNDHVHIDKDHIFVNGKDYHDDWKQHRTYYMFKHFPMAILTFSLFICLWFTKGTFHPYWLIFFAVPIYESIVSAIHHKDPYRFAYPVVAVLAFLCLGLFRGMWHPGWVVFLTVPVYYWFVSLIAGPKYEKCNYDYDKSYKEYEWDKKEE